MPLVRVPELVVDVPVTVAVTLSSTITGPDTFIVSANTLIMVNGPGLEIEFVLIDMPGVKPSVIKLPDNLSILLPDASNLRGIAPEVGAPLKLHDVVLP